VFLTFGVDPFTRVYPKKRRMKKLEIFSNPMIFPKGSE